jgi:hypothetical protein
MRWTLYDLAAIALLALALVIDLVPSLGSAAPDQRAESPAGEPPAPSRGAQWTEEGPAMNKGEPKRGERSQSMSAEDLARKFETLADAWATHRATVGMSSRWEDALEHPSYRALVRLGRPAVPLIIERYGNDEQRFFVWAFVLDDITGLRIVLGHTVLDGPDARRRYLAWWEKQKGQWTELTRRDALAGDTEEDRAAKPGRVDYMRVYHEKKPTPKDEFEKRFAALADKWLEWSEWTGPSLDFFLNRPEYRELVKLGKPAVPLIMELYSKDDFLQTDPRYWEFVLDEITGLKIVGDPATFDPKKVRRRYLEWWAKEKDRWTPGAKTGGEPKQIP